MLGVNTKLLYTWYHKKKKKKTEKFLNKTTHNIVDHIKIGY